MSKIEVLGAQGTGISRRNFLAGAGAGLFVLGTSRNLAWSQSATQTVLSGTEFDLQIGETPVNFTGKRADRAQW